MEKRYKKGGSAGSKGVDFQVDLLIVCFLNALRELSDWKLSTENGKAAKFDDVVLECPKGNVFIQAKSKKSKKVTFQDFTSTNPRNNDFSLGKYFLSYQEIKKSFSVRSVIICSNADVDEKTLDFLNCRKSSSEDILHYKSADCSFYTFNESLIPVLQEHVRDYYVQNTRDKDKCDLVTTEEEIRGFLDHLQLYFNYPSGNDVKKIIEHNLRTGTIDSCQQINYLEIRSKLMDWFQQKSGVYITEAYARGMLFEIRRDKYWQKLDLYNVTFQSNNINFADMNRIYYLSTDHGSLLQEIRIFQFLKSYRRKVLYINGNDDPQVQKQVMEAFALPWYTFLVLIKDRVTTPTGTEEASLKLKQILSQSGYKKLILVGRHDSSFVRQIRSGIDGEVMFAPVRLTDLSMESKYKLLRKKNIIFQGEKVSLKELFPNEDTDYYEKAIKFVSEKLVLDEEILVGTPVLKKFLSQYYIDRTFKSWQAEGSLSEKDLCQVDAETVLITDAAGMGKSTVLTKLAMLLKENHPHLWVITVELNDFAVSLKELSRSGRQTATAEELLNSKDATKLRDDFEKFVFATDKKVVLLVDGVDEISPDYTKIVLSLLSHCQKSSNFSKIYVTTRPHLNKELQVGIQIKSFTLEPFTEENQVSFLDRYWTHNLHLEDEKKRSKCKRYAEALISETQLWFANYLTEHVTAVPLHVTMLAEIFQENGLGTWEGCKEYVNSNNEEIKFPGKLNMANLYDMFIQKKRDIFIQKENPNGHVGANQALAQLFDECAAYHRSSALELIFNEYELDFIPCYQKVDKSMEASVLKIGIVQTVDDNLQVNFLHRTFAEYFVAQSLLNELRQQNISLEFQKFFVEEITRRFPFETVCNFLDNLLYQEIDSLPADIFQNYYSSTNNNLPGSFHLLHSLVENGWTAILQLFFKCIGFEIVRNKEYHVVDLWGRDNITEHCIGNWLAMLHHIVKLCGVNFRNDDGETPLQLAASRGHLQMIKYLISQGAHTDTEDDNGFTPITRAIREGHLAATKLLIEPETDLIFLLNIAMTYECMNVASYILSLILDSEGADTKHPLVAFASAYFGQMHLLETLREQGTLDANDKIYNGETLLFAAAKGGQLDVIKYLIRQGADINHTCSEGGTALHKIASRPSLITAAELLVDLGIDVNIKNFVSETVLHIAAEFGTFDMVRMLIEKGVDVDYQNCAGQTALLLAIHNGKLDVVELLLKSGANVHVRNNTGQTALHVAASHGRDLDFLKFLVELGVDFKLTDNTGKTVLHSLSFFTSTGMFEYFVGLGMDINARDRSGCTLLHAVADSFGEDRVKWLVENGIDVNIRNEVGETALFQAVADYRILEYLLENGAEVNAKDYLGRTVLFRAVEEGEYLSANILVRNGIHVDSKDNTGLSAIFQCVESYSYSTLNSLYIPGYVDLHSQVYWNTLDVVEYLVGEGANINLRTNHGQTVLHFATKKNHVDTVKFLFKLGADLNAKNNAGQTPLHIAALEGNRVVKWLVELGADVSCKDSHGRTAEDLARKMDHLHLLEYLTEFKKQPRFRKILCCSTN